MPALIVFLICLGLFGLPAASIITMILLVIWLLLLANS